MAQANSAFGVLSVPASARASAPGASTLTDLRSSATSIEVYWFAKRCANSPGVPGKASSQTSRIIASVL